MKPRVSLGLRVQPPGGGGKFTKERTPYADSGSAPPAGEARRAGLSFLRGRFGEPFAWFSPKGGRVGGEQARFGAAGAAPRRGLAGEVRRRVSWRRRREVASAAVQPHGRRGGVALMG